MNNDKYCWWYRVYTVASYGNSIIDNLYSQIDYLREKRKLEVKGRISKVPIYISVISVLFFVPLLLLIILGPVILNYFK